MCWITAENSANCLLTVNAGFCAFRRKTLALVSFILGILCYLKKCVCYGCVLGCLLVLTGINILCAKSDDERQHIHWIEWENVEVNKYFMPRNVLICLGHSGIMNSVRKWCWEAPGIWCLSNEVFLSNNSEKNLERWRTSSAHKKIPRTSVHVAARDL